MNRLTTAGLALVATLATFAAPVLAQSRTGTLHVVVQDQSGAVVPGAVVQVRGAERANAAVVRNDLVSDGRGVAVASDLTPGKYAVEVAFPGFETRVLPEVRVRAGENRQVAMLAIQKLDESMTVGRDPATSASDPKNDRFGTTLSKDQIEALPDDPDEMEKVLKEMAGPGASIRVDGFTGGKLPPKSQIRSIRMAQSMFAAENHSGGMSFVDITTQPGMGPVRGSLDFMFRDDSLNARNAFVDQKGPEQTQQYTLNMSGTLLKERTSFSFSAGGASLYDSANIYVGTPGGPATGAVRRPSDRVNFNGRIDHALTRSHTLRGNYQQNASEQSNLGVGSFDVATRAYSQRSDDRLFRLSENGPWSKALFGETRLQVHWTTTEASSAEELPTVRVLDSFTTGGAQQAGGREATEIEYATNVDWARGKHAVRFGTLVEGGWYRSDTRTNYLGTYTFNSLAAFEAGLPSNYTRRVGDPLVTYSQWQAGFYVQDDWRARKNLTVSAGVRQELQTNLDDKWNLSPRAGLTWSPFRNGKTTVRVGAGLFHDWLDATTFEQTLRVDGARQQDQVIRFPGYPDPFAGGAFTEVLPTSKYMLSSGLVMPTRAMLNVGINQQLTPMMGLNLSYTRTNGYDRFRGRNVNAPLGDGSRPDPSLGNVTQVESTARMTGDQLNVGFNMNIPARRTFLFANYSWINQRNDADGPFSLPADNYSLAGEWGPAAGVPHYFFSTMLNTSLPKNVRLGLSGTARGGTPYNITTGLDTNRDTVFNDRPAGVSRNSATGKGMWDVAARVSYAFGFGERQAASGMPGGPIMIVQRVGGGAGDMLGALGGGGAENKRIRFEVYASVSNVFNHVNPVGYSGVMTSQFFGEPTASLPARKIDLGVRIGF
ncbi:MAG TPA: TonB-dependent receptor [Vicinamibacterales bacterium]